MSIKCDSCGMEFASYSKLHRHTDRKKPCGVVRIRDINDPNLLKNVIWKHVNCTRNICCYSRHM